MTAPDAAFMRRAFELAVQARGRVEPNPVVGAVVVRDGAIVGEGWHDSYGGPHAEVNALAQAGSLAQGADIYISLEPCSTVGKTPACCDALMRAGIARVIYASEDPNPKHAGRAGRILQEAGIAVQARFLAEEGDVLLDDFRHQLGFTRPVVVAKWASSLDGRIATRSGESKWISGERSRRHAHEERARSEGILVGIGTILADDPGLDVRHVQGRSPRPVILDSSLRTPASARALARSDALICTSVGAGTPAQRKELEARGAELLFVDTDEDGRPRLEAVLRGLKERGIHRLMVEGGGEVLGSFFAAGLVDIVQVYLASLVIGDAEAKSALRGPRLDELAAAARLDWIETRRFDDDLFCSYRVRRTR